MVQDMFREAAALLPGIDLKRMPESETPPAGRTADPEPERTKPNPSKKCSC
jgi:hypothetical protein